MLRTVKFRAPANVFLRRAQIVLILAALVPTVLATSAAIVLLALGSGSLVIVGGVLVLAFCTSSLTGYIIVSIFVSRGASLARIQNDFMSSVSHELRTPMTSMRMFIETLREDRVTPEEKGKCLNILHHEMVRLDGLVTKLMDLSKIESGRKAFEHKLVTVADIVDEARGAFDVIRLGHDDVELEVDVAAGLHLRGDKSALVQALTNLLANAYKYTPDDEKRIALTVALRGQKHVVFSVSDNGPGIKASEQDAIFDKFSRGLAADGAREAGSGLGLAIVKGIALAHKGTVELESSPHQGATFRVVIPRRVK